MWLNVGGPYHLESLGCQLNSSPYLLPRGPIGWAPSCCHGCMPNQRRGICPPPGRTSCSGTTAMAAQCLIVCVRPSVDCTAVCLSVYSIPRSYIRQSKVAPVEQWRYYYTLCERSTPGSQPTYRCSVGPIVPAISFHPLECGG